MAAAALALPQGAPTAAATVGAVDVASPAGDVVVVTVNAHQRDIDDARMNELAAGLGTRVGLTPTAADVIVVEVTTQSGLIALRDKLNARMNASYAVVGLSSDAGLTSDVKVKLLLNTTTMDYTGRTSWLDVCDSPAPTCKYSDHRFVWAQLRLPGAPQPIHVGDLDGARTTEKSGWRATATVRVHSAQEAPVAGVVVSGRWSSSASTQTCTTDATGSCSMTSEVLKSSSVRLTVTGLQSLGAAYSGANHDPDTNSNDSSASNGTWIDIRR